MASTPQARKVFKICLFYERIARVDVFREKCYTALFWMHDMDVWRREPKERKSQWKAIPRDKWPDNPDIKDEDFFLNSAKVIASGIFKGDTALRRAIKELVKYGFIVCIVPGKTGRKDLKAVYRMSDKWKNITQGEITGSEKLP